MIVRLAALALVLLAAPAMACEPGMVTDRVTYVRDVDTIEFGELAIRLDGLAAPEWNEPAWRRRTGTPRADAATTFTA